MACSRESSPASEAGTSSPAQLTPNSKVKAMLAAFDKDSDDESISGFARARLLSSIAKTTYKPTETTRISDTATRTEDTSQGTRHEDSEDDEEEEIVRPKGRMAAKMLVKANNSDEDETAVDDARERVRKMLMTKSKAPDPAANSQDGGGSGEENAPVPSQKRKFRVPRRETPKSSPTKKAASPGLFVSPQPDKVASRSSDMSDSDELPENPGSNDRFLALLAKKREEHLAREAELAKIKAKKAAERQGHSSLLEEDDRFDDSDGNVERRLTQQARPSRKASKRALEEMQRETQRLSRNQQLAHNATTRKKFPKTDLFAKWNFKAGRHVEEPAPEPARPTSSSSAAPQFDLEMKDTPPTSPASHEEENRKLTIAPTLPVVAPEVEEDAADNSPTNEVDLTRTPLSPSPRSDKGKGKAIEEPTLEPEISKRHMFTQRPIRVRAPKIADRKVPALDDSDSDLEIVTAKTPVLKKKLESIFDRVPARQAKESHPLHVLRLFSNLTSPGKQNTGRKKKPMTTTELQVSLQQRARQQAAREREERLQALRDKGIIVQTAEEREREMVDVDDLLAKARREDEELMRREKAAAKKERKDRGEVDPLGDSSDDEDWDEGEEDILDELSVSGSDDEIASEVEGKSGDEEVGNEEAEKEEEDLMATDDEQPRWNPMFDNEAAENDGDDSGSDLSINEEIAEYGDVDEDEEEPGKEIPFKLKSRRRRNPKVISDDEDEVEEIDEQPTPHQPQTESPVQLHSESPIAPNSVLRSATKTFIPGLTVAGPAGLGLTQIFAGTMDESQMDPFEAFPTPRNGSGKDSLAFLRQLPAPELPPFVPTMAEDTQDVQINNPSQLSHIPESQPMDSGTQGIELNFSQSQIHGFDSLVQDTQLSQFPEATQDAGFQHMTPIKGRFVDAPPSTVDTVMLDPTAVPETMEENPIIKKKGKLRRRAQVASFSDDEDAADPTESNIDEDEFDITSNAFDVMRKASKKKFTADEFDKKKSKAKEMVNEQAEESEDEYAGLGGASDDESGEEDAYAKEIIDDEGCKDVDERKLAAFFADRERASDEKQVEKLYKDITNGMLRRKRGADYDLSDSDDGGEARQRMKRKEFAKMRKALLADERIGKIAENPKRQAFLRAIEDRGGEDEIDFLDEFVEQEETTDSLSQGEGSQQIIPNSQPTDIGPSKRKRFDDATEAESRPPPHLRRTKPTKKASNLSEIRESLSSLIEEPNAVISQVESGSDTEDELEIEGDHDLGPRRAKDKENRDPFALRRKNVPIIDRISLKRASSHTVSNSTRLAFATSSTNPGFKVPPLLRRATTNNSLVSTASSSVSGGMSSTERMAGGSGGSDGVKRGGGKNSGVHYFARESERRAAVVKTEKRREQKLAKGAQVRRKVVGGLFGGGKFE